MSDFLDCAAKHLRSGHSHIQDSKSQFEDVFATIAALDSIHAKSFLDLNNIETLFGAIEMGLVIGKFADKSPEETRALREALVTLIYRTLELAVAIPVKGGRVTAPDPYGEFIDAITDPHRGETSHLDCSFITFNYDLALDFTLWHKNIESDYCLDEGAPSRGVPLLKLHGSINWAMEQQSELISPRPIQDRDFAGAGMPGTSLMALTLGTEIANRTRNGQSAGTAPVIVPPTWNKTMYHGQLTRVWQHAADVLGKAENIFVIGYSLPETDSFFRYLYALGTQGSSRLERFWVFDPDKSGTVEGRFRDMIGRGVASRFKFHNLKFSEAIPEIKKALEKP